MESENAYSLLHVPSTASPDEILHAYRHESLKYHPRRFDPGDRFIEIHFRKLADAYETLIDPQRRREYDHQLRLKELRKVRNPDCSRLFDPQQHHERQRRHSTAAAPTRPFSASQHPPSMGTHGQSHAATRSSQPTPVHHPPSASRADPPAEPRARRSSISGLAPIPSLHQLQQLKPQPRIPPSSAFSQSKPLHPSSAYPPARAGSCVPAMETSGPRQSSSRLEESLLSMRLNQYPTPHGSQQSSSQKGRVSRQSIINELNSRARSSSSAAYRPPHPISTTSSSSASSSLPSSTSPSSSLSSSFSPRQPSRFSSSPSSAAPLSRQNFAPAPDLSSHFNPPRRLASSSQHWFVPPNDDEYQPLSQSHTHNRPPHPRMSSASSYASQLHMQRRNGS